VETPIIKFLPQKKSEGNNIVEVLWSQDQLV
jgi:hypothetical protein